MSEKELEMQQKISEIEGKKEQSFAWEMLKQQGAANKRQFIIIIVLILALIASNLGWIIYESQYEDVVTTTQKVTQETDSGTNNFIGGDNFGKTDDRNNENKNES